MGKTARYCRHCGQPRPPLDTERVLAELSRRLVAVETRLDRAELQLRTIDLQDPRIGAEGWHDTIRRIVRDVLRQEGH